MTQPSQDTSLSNLLRGASCAVKVAHDPTFHVTFLSGYLKRLWTKHHYMGDAPFHCICSENPCFILEFLKSLGLSKDEDIRLFLRRTESLSEDILMSSKNATKSSGATKKASKSRKKSEGGGISPSASSRKGRICHGPAGK